MFIPHLSPTVEVHHCPPSAGVRLVHAEEGLKLLHLPDHAGNVATNVGVKHRQQT